jgi:hypothetical protein
MKLKITRIIVLALTFSLGYATASLQPFGTTSGGSPVTHTGASLDAELPAAAELSGIAEPAAVAQAQAWPESQLAEGSMLLVQRDLGYRCATSSGICSLPYPQPLGSPCTCSDGTRGTTVR